MSKRPSSKSRSLAAALLPPAALEPVPLPRGATRPPEMPPAKVTDGPGMSPSPRRYAALSGEGICGTASPVRGLSWIAACCRERAFLLPPSLLTLRPSLAKVLLLLRCTLQYSDRGDGQQAGSDAEHGARQPLFLDG